MSAVRIRSGHPQPDEGSKRKPVTDGEQAQAEEAVENVRKPGRTPRKKKEKK